MSKNTKLFFGGIPTDIDVKRLRESWPENDMKPGDKFSYTAIETVLNESRQSNRFRTITNRWRRVVEHATGTIIGPDNGEGLKVLSETEKLELSRSKLRTSARMGRRSLTVLARTDRRALSEADQAAYDHQQKVSANTIAAANLRQKKLEMPTM